MTSKAMTQKLELYLHIPFCLKKCSYCDFLSFQGDETEREAYVEALLREISSYREFALEYEVTTVFLGGGTPSILNTSQMERIMESLRQTFFIQKLGEITIEANPGTLNRDKLRAYRSMGINRLSMGLQSFNNKDLKCLGRIHTCEVFAENYEQARNAGFTNINIDLMSGIPYQTLQGWEENLRQAVKLAPEHISAYSLIIEEGTPFYRQKLTLSPEEEERAMYELTYNLLREYGYLQYEISNYAKPGYACRHNIGYWKRKNYLGLGLGAASLIREVRFSNTSDWKAYLEHSSEPWKIRGQTETLGEKEQMEEFMFLGLRLIEGIGRQDFSRAFHKNIEDVYKQPIDKYLSLGLLEAQNGRIFLTREGISLSNMVMSDFLL